MTATLHSEFSADWQVRILDRPPLIAPARQYIWPRIVAGEDDTLARGAMFLDVKPKNGANFLATCALGFASPSVPSGVWTCPNPVHLLAISGGYAYLVDTGTPEVCSHIDLKPVVTILPLPSEGLVVLAGFHHAVAIDANGIRWTSGKLTWEGLTLVEVRDGQLHGAGWNMPLDRDVPFALDLKTGIHTGGGFEVAK